MELGSLLTKFNQPKTNHSEQFLAVCIGSETVHAAVWQMDTDIAKIASLGSIEEWSGDESKLATTVDASLATALESIEREPDKIIFGLPESWVVDDKIAPERQPLLKDLADKLSLKPIGFVVITEALTHWLKAKEGTPPTTILLELSETEVIVTLVKIGKSSGSKIVGRSDDLGADVEEGLARFGQAESLPSRMIMYDGHLDLEAARQTLLSYPWQDKLPFLHFPKIEILDKDVVIRAVSFAGGTDTTTATPDTPEEKTPPTPTPEAMGFYKNTDVGTPTPPTPTMVHHPLPQAHPPHTHIPTSQVKSRPSLLTKIAHAIRHQFHQLQLMVTTIKPKKIPIIAGLVVGALGICVAGAVGAYWALPSATVTLYVTPKTIRETVQVIIDPTHDTDINKKQLHGETLESEAEDTLQKDTTGESEVGDKAKGDITLFNKTSGVKKFPTGTILSGPSGLQFTLDKDISVASQSATDTGITFGKTITAITASQVGSDSNIGSNVSLTIKGFDTSSYSAKTNIALTGGSSRQVHSVAKSDQDTLLKELTEKLTGQAIDTLKSRADSDETVIDTGVVTAIVDKKFTKAVGDEADTVSLTAKLRVKTLKFKTSELLQLASNASKDATDFTPVNDAISVTLQDVDIEQDQAAVTAAVNTQLIPKLNSQEIISNIKGKYPEETENYLKSLPNFSKVEIEFSPKLPKKLATFPHRAANIHLDIKVKP